MAGESEGWWFWQREDRVMRDACAKEESMV
jgi:hypothetical protein